MKYTTINQVLCLLTLMLGTLQVASQDMLSARIQDKTKLSEVMEVVEEYYADKPAKWRGPDGSSPRMLDWKRWEWYMSGRLGPSGEFVDIQEHLRKALPRVEAMTPADQRMNGEWSLVGPETISENGIGRADRIAFHPTDPDIMYVGASAGGLWKTEDGGNTWIALSDHIPSVGISGIIVSWQDPNDIYILTGDADSEYLFGFVSQFKYARKCVGVLKSTNGGATWHPTGQINVNQFIGFNMAQDPTDHNVLLVATNLGLYRTENGGATWTQVRTGVFTDVEFLPGTSFAVAASTSEIVWSLSGGALWDASVLDVPMSNITRVELEVTPANPTVVYALLGGPGPAGTYNGTYKSTNSGISFTQQSSTPNILGKASDGSDNKDQSKYDLCMAVAPWNHNMVITGAVKIWHSFDAGVTFTYAQNGVHADVHDLAYNPLDDALYACTDGGIYKSQSNGNAWTPYWNGFAASQIYHMAGTPLDNNYLVAGFQDNGVKQKNAAGGFWAHVMLGDGFDVKYFPNDKSQFYVTRNMQMYHASNSGANLDNITPDPDGEGNKEWFGTVAVHNSNPNIVFAGYSNVFRSTDAGQSWTDLGASGSWAMATCPSNSNRIYVAGSTSYDVGTLGMWRSDSLGSNWTQLNYKPGFPSSAFVEKITDIAVNPLNSYYVYVTAGGFAPGKKVYRSTNAGENWENWSGSLPDIPINCVAITGNGTGVYIGTDLGVFYRHIAMSDWMPFRNGLPNVPVTDIYINENVDRIYVSTFGRGVWSAPVVDNCPGSLVLSGEIEGYYHYQASDQIRTTNTVSAGLGNQLHLKAGNYILLQPGFVAKRRSVWTGQIGGCGTGGIPEATIPLEEPVTH